MSDRHYANGTPVTVMIVEHGPLVKDYYDEQFSRQFSHARLVHVPMIDELSHLVLVHQPAIVVIEGDARHSRDFDDATADQRARDNVIPYTIRLRLDGFRGGIILVEYREDTRKLLQRELEGRVNAIIEHPYELPAAVKQLTLSLRR